MGNFANRQMRPVPVLSAIASVPQCGLRHAIVQSRDQGNRRDSTSCRATPLPSSSCEMLPEKRLAEARPFLWTIETRPVTTIIGGLIFRSADRLAA